MSRKPYINAEELRDEFAKSKTNGQCTDRLGEMFLIITERILRHKNFSRYPQAEREDLQSFALEKLLRSIHTVDVGKEPKSLFNYATRIVFNAFLSELKKYYRQ